MTHKSVCKLPDKPSALIRLAIADLKKAEKAPAYIIEMDAWHSPLGDGKVGYDPLSCEVTPVRCEICLAGSVMAFTLSAPEVMDLYPEHYSQEVRDKLLAIDSFRGGCFRRALDQLGISQAKRRKAIKAFQLEEVENEYHQMEITDYENDPAKFKREMLALAAKLEKVGL